MKRTILALAVLGLVALAAPRPASARVSVFLGVPGFFAGPPVYAPPVVVAPPRPCTRASGMGRATLPFLLWLRPAVLGVQGALAPSTLGSLAQRSSPACLRTKAERSSHTTASP